MTSSTRVRLRFAKCGDLRLISHHDLLRCVERVVRRAEIPVARSQGFHPRPKIVFTLAMALGVEGRREVVELDLTEPVPPADVLTRLRGVAPAGLKFLEAEAVPIGRPAHAASVEYQFDLPGDRIDAARGALARFLASDAWPYTRLRPDRDREIVIDLRHFVLDARIEGAGCLRFRMKITSSGAARPEEVLDALGLRDLLERGAVLIRSELELAPRTESCPEPCHEAG
jgi:radical SAM-linked protein